MNKQFDFSIENRRWLTPLISGVVLLVVAVIIGYSGAWKAFWSSYLVAYSFSLAILIGALFFVMVNNVARAKWHIVLRRIPETLAWSFPLMFLLGLPILLFGMHDLYHWTHHELFVEGSPEYDPVIAGKESYLNMPFFWIRFVLYFLIWSWLAYRLHRLSVLEDTKPDGAADHVGPLTRLALSLHMAGTGQKKEVEFGLLRRITSAWGILLSALATAFGSFDLLMSLDPHWFSTIFGVYYFAGGFVTAAAIILLTALYFRRHGILVHTITDEHYHDLGKYMFAFTVFWAYIAVSQLLLIWYANLPEETIFFRHRAEHGWYAWSMLLLYGHFVLPFFLLIGRTIKRKKVGLALMAIWLVVMHFVDMYWLAMPSLYPDYVPYGQLGLNILCVLGFVGIFVGVFLWKIRLHSLVPYNDRSFSQSLAFENV